MTTTMTKTSDSNGAWAPSQYVIDAGWDYHCIEATAAMGVSEADAEDLTERQQADLLTYCKAKVAARAAEQTTPHTTMSRLETTDFETADFETLWGLATPTQRQNAEEAATVAMAAIHNPAAGAREIVIAAELRRELAAECKLAAKFGAWLRSR